MNIIDVVIVLFLAMGLIVGFKRGIFKSAVMFLGTILVFVLAFYLKNPLSELMYTYLPFFPLGGTFAGVQVFNILLYEALAFFLVYIILMAVLHIIIKITGIFEKILKFTIILGLPSKFLGAIFGFFESYIMLFLLLFVIGRLSFATPLINDSALAYKIMSASPGLSTITNDYFQSFEEIYNLKDKYDDKEIYNQEALKILLKYQVITPESASRLVKSGKLNFNGVEEIIENIERTN